MDRADAQFWNQTSASLLVGLEATPAGLSQHVARKRSERLGPNTLQVRGEPPSSSNTCATSRTRR